MLKCIGEQRGWTLWPYGQRYSDFNDEGILGKSMSGGNLPTADGRYSLSLQDKKAWIPTHLTEQSIPLPPVNMEVKTWECSSYLSNKASFHVHDMGERFRARNTSQPRQYPDQIHFFSKKTYKKRNKQQHQSCQCGETLPKNKDIHRKMSF